MTTVVPFLVTVTKASPVDEEEKPMLSLSFGPVMNRVPPERELIEILFEFVVMGVDWDVLKEYVTPLIE